MRVSIVAAGMLAGMMVTAQAGQANIACYRKVATPPVYGTFSQKVVVSPARTVYETIPARYATGVERVLVRPAQTIPHHVPAITSTVAEKVMVRPASRVWMKSVDSMGGEAGCWVDKPAVYETRHRTVVVRPATTTYSVVPAEYRTVTRQVMVSPATTMARTIPAVYGTSTYQAQISPGSVGWQPAPVCN